MTGWCLEHLEPGQRVVELCAGSGAISKAVAIEGAGYEQWAVEVSPDAVSYLVGNLADTDVRVVEATWPMRYPSSTARSTWSS